MKRIVFGEPKEQIKLRDVKTTDIIIVRNPSSIPSRIHGVLIRGKDGLYGVFDNEKGHLFGNESSLMAALNDIHERGWILEVIT